MEDFSISTEEPINPAIPVAKRHESSEDKLAGLKERRLQELLSVPEGEDIFGTNVQTVARLTVECPKCSQQMGATRFALHYEKCLNKGSRARANSVSTPVRNGEPTPSEDSWSAPCSTCKSIETPETMVMCDGCSRVFHLWCLVPRLSEIPEGAWMCRKCSLRLVPAVPGEDPTLILQKKRGGRQSAKDKVKKGRLAAGFDIVDFYCDLCNTVIPPDQTRFRCLTCGEFDVCINCKSKGGLGHRTSHLMVELKIS